MPLPTSAAEGSPEPLVRPEHTAHATSRARLACPRPRSSCVCSEARALEASRGLQQLLTRAPCAGPLPALAAKGRAPGSPHSAPPLRPRPPPPYTTARVPGRARSSSPVLWTAQPPTPLSLAGWHPSAGSPGVPGPHSPTPCSLPSFVQMTLAWSQTPTSLRWCPGTGLFATHPVWTVNSLRGSPPRDRAWVWLQTGG